MSESPLLNQVRQMILDGELAPGQRITEAALAERLGISRTPIRSVLPALAAEGFLRPVGRRGFAVTAFSNEESLEALELRAVLEGQAARIVAQRRPAPKLLATLEGCLNAGDAIFLKGFLEEGDKEGYGEMNAVFHEAIVQASCSTMLVDLIERLNRAPFVHPAIMVFDRFDTRAVFNLLYHAHGHHHAIVEALKQGDAFRCEMLFREHANGQRHSMFEKRSHGLEPAAAA